MKMKVDTPFGILVVEKSSDPNYPGVWVSLIEEINGEEVEETLALIETHDLKDGNGYIRLLAYTNLDKDEETHELFYYHKGNDEEAK